jgi:hypothetical protein
MFCFPFCKHEKRNAIVATIPLSSLMYIYERRNNNLKIFKINRFLINSMK